MSTAEKIFQKTQTLPESAQDAILHVVEQFALQYPPPATEPLTLREAAKVRGQVAAWEADWNAPGMEVYDRP